MPGEWWSVFDVEREELGFLVVGILSAERWVRKEKERWADGEGKGRCPVTVQEVERELELRERERERGSDLEEGEGA